ncbi:LysM peptidoglycan-binding domain-containing protein [Dyella monticola]|uniref:LysM peptidoglycan-binding domain-containing protein n=2 Tax=Dyella monticola TaxID=1927958 RepID=A0A370X617_9GAMM|nr:LysM peptidoglycan-binding domain-containing protein [Dyella monticola]
MLTRMNGWMRWSAIAAIALLMTGCSTVVVQPPPGAQGAPRPVPAAHEAGTYTVVKGDTLYSIAFRNGTDFREVARINGIAEPYTIWPGQLLKLPGYGAPPAHAPPPVVAKTSSPGVPAPVFQSVETTPVTPAPTHTSPVAVVPVPSAHSVQPSPASSAATNVPAAPAVAATPMVASTGGARVAGGVKWHWPASGSVVGRFQSNAAIPGIDIAGKAGDPVVAAADGVVVYSGNGLVGYGELIIIKHNDSFLSAYGHNRKRLVTEGQQVKAGQQIAEMGSTGSSRDELQFQIRKDGNPVDPLDYLPSR